MRRILTPQEKERLRRERAERIAAAKAKIKSSIQPTKKADPDWGRSSGITGHPLTRLYTMDQMHHLLSQTYGNVLITQSIDGRTTFVHEGTGGTMVVLARGGAVAYYDEGYLPDDWAMFSDRSDEPDDFDEPDWSDAEDDDEAESDREEAIDTSTLVETITRNSEYLDDLRYRRSEDENYLYIRDSPRRERRRPEEADERPSTKPEWAGSAKNVHPPSSGKPNYLGITFVIAFVVALITQFFT